MHLGAIHLWYKGHVDWIIPSWINNQSINQNFSKNVNFCTKYPISQKSSDEYFSNLACGKIYISSMYVPNHVDWNFPSVIDYWLITNTPQWFYHFLRIIGQYLQFCLMNFFYIYTADASWCYTSSARKVMLIESFLHWSIINQLIEKWQNFACTLISETVHRRAKRTKIWTLWAI